MNDLIEHSAFGAPVSLPIIRRGEVTIDLDEHEVI